VLAGSDLGVLARKLRDAGFDDDQLRLPGSSLGRRWSAVVIEIGSDAMTGARGVLESLDAQQVAVVPLHSNIADVFAGEAAPTVDVK